MSTTEVTKDQLDLFGFVIEILNDLKVPYWLDQGSLLGIVRQGSFLPWDHDVDLGIWKEDYFKHKKTIHKKLSEKGVRITFVPYVSKMKYQGEGQKSIPVNIRLYHREQGFAFSEFWSVISDNKSLLKKNSLYLRNMNRSVKVRKYCLKTPTRRVLLSPIRGLNHLFFQIMVNLRESLKTRRVVFRVPEHYLLNPVNKNIYDLNVPVPKNPEAYIALKYGEKWREPNKNWVWYKDDGASYSMHVKKRSLFNKPKHFDIADYDRK